VLKHLDDLDDIELVAFRETKYKQVMFMGELVSFCKTKLDIWQRWVHIRRIN
jgi:hypothetical protein